MMTAVLVVWLWSSRAIGQANVLTWLLVGGTLTIGLSCAVVARSTTCSLLGGCGNAVLWCGVARAHCWVLREQARILVGVGGLVLEVGLFPRRTASGGWCGGGFGDGLVVL